MKTEGQPASPKHLRLGPPGREIEFVLRPDLLALYGSPATPAATRVLFSLPGAATEVVAAGDVAASDPRRRGPVYAQVPAGDLAVPTGRVFVRFAAAGRPMDWHDRLASLGLAPVADHTDAPGTAWVMPADGRIETGLSRLDQVSAITGVEAVEPELLRESRRR